MFLWIKACKYVSLYTLGCEVLIQTGFFTIAKCLQAHTNHVWALSVGILGSSTLLDFAVLLSFFNALGH